MCKFGYPTCEQPTLTNPQSLIVMDDLLNETKEDVDETDDNAERLEITKAGGGRAMSPPSVT